MRDSRTAPVSAPGPTPTGGHAAVLDAMTARVRAFYDALGPDRERWVARNRYYYDELARLLQLLVPPGQRVLDVGCGNGDHLAAVRAAVGVGVDLAGAKHPRFTFIRQAAEELSLPGDDRFDAVLLVNVVGELADVLAALKRLRPLGRDDTRLVIVYYNHLWEPVVAPAARLGLELLNPTQNRLSLENLRGFLHFAGFEAVRVGARTPCPKYVPGLASLANRVLERLPLLEHFGFIHYVVARPEMPLLRPPTSYACTVVVPCKNEEEKVPEIAPRVLEMGAYTEIVFVRAPPPGAKSTYNPRWTHGEDASPPPWPPTPQLARLRVSPRSPSRAVRSSAATRRQEASTTGCVRRSSAPCASASGRVTAGRATRCSSSCAQGARTSDRARVGARLPRSPR